MANIKSAKKRIKTIGTRTVRRKSCISFLKSSIKKAALSVESGSNDAKSNISNAIRAIDKSVSKGFLHKNNAARKKSKLARSLATSKK